MSATAPDPQETPTEQAPTLPPRTVDFPAADGATLPGGRPTVPGHEILGELGRGGMGVVYKARHVRLGRLVALKMILAGGHAGQTELARFQGEAEALARLQHPNIVQIFEAGEVNGLPFFSLEFVEGGSLAGKRPGGPWSPAEAARLVETLARAVAAAHQAGVVHRDLKPANVLLTADGTPKITDFGLAKRLDGQTLNTQSGAILGTPSYMAPEQAGAKGHAVGPPADVYALGAILYELLTGRPPFQAATPLETVLQVVSDDPTPPRKLRPDLPRDLETVCLKCLAKDPRQRYADATALADDLRRFQKHQPVRAKHRPRRRRRGWRDPVLLGVVGLLLLVLVGGGIAFFFLGGSNQPTPPGLRGMGPRGMGPILPRIEMPEMPAIPKMAGTLRIWDVSTGASLADVCGPAGFVVHLEFSPDGTRLAGANADSAVVVRDAATGKALFEVKGATCVFAPDGQKLITTGGLGFDPLKALNGQDQIHVWDARDGTRQSSFGKTRGQLLAAALSRDGRRLAAVDSGGAELDGKKIKLLPQALKLWDVPSGQEVFSRPLTKPLGPLVFSPDDARFFALSPSNETVRAWDAGTGRELAVPFRGNDLTFLGDGKHLATAWVNGPVKIWDATSGKDLQTLEVAGPAFAPDGKRLAAIAVGKAAVWDVEANKELYPLPAGPRRVTHVAFSPDGRRLAGACPDGTILIWDAATGKQLHALRGHPKGAAQLRFSPDGRRLASVSYDGTVTPDAPKAP